MDEVSIDGESMSIPLKGSAAGFSEAAGAAAGASMDGGMGEPKGEGGPGEKGDPAPGEAGAGAPPKDGMPPIGGAAKGLPDVEEPTGGRPKFCPNGEGGAAGGAPAPEGPPKREPNGMGSGAGAVDMASAGVMGGDAAPGIGPAGAPGIAKEKGLEAVTSGAAMNGFAEPIPAGALIGAGAGVDSGAIAMENGDG
jgi:hypothetical protein